MKRIAGSEGKIEIRYEGEHGNGPFVLKPAGFAACHAACGTNYRVEQD